VKPYASIIHAGFPVRFKQVCAAATVGSWRWKDAGNFTGFDPTFVARAILDEGKGSASLLPFHDFPGGRSLNMGCAMDTGETPVTDSDAVMMARFKSGQRIAMAMTTTARTNATGTCHLRKT